MYWYFKTRFGIFKIVPTKNGRYELMMNDEFLGNYHSPEAAADDVYTQHSKHDPWDEASNIDPPDGLMEWEIFNH
jgi:hypothetical protein